MPVGAPREIPSASIERPRARKTITPASLKSKWEREWSATTQLPIEIVEGSKQERDAVYRRARPGFLVANYEQVVRDLPAILDGFRPDIVVLYEAQRIKNWATLTAAWQAGPGLSIGRSIPSEGVSRLGGCDELI